MKRRKSIGAVATTSIRIARERRRDRQQALRRDATLAKPARRLSRTSFYRAATAAKAAARSLSGPARQRPAVIARHRRWA
jgi:hypothetical protein